MKEFIEIPFGAKDSELCGWEYTIPKGFVASIENGKIIVKKEEDYEDERIRKKLIEAVKGDMIVGGTKDKQRAIAWLEKQGEDKEINNFNVLPGLYKCVHRMFDGTPDGKLLFEVGNIYKCLSKHDRAEFEVSYGHSVYLEDPVVCKHFIPFEKQGKKKPQRIISAEAKEAMYDKPVWSEEDERMCYTSIKGCQYIINSFEYSTQPFKDAIDWLKSIKGRLQPQWKPSDEQIQALEYQVNSTYIGSWQYKASKELLEQLKKL